MIHTTRSEYTRWYWWHRDVEDHGSFSCNFHYGHINYAVATDSIAVFILQRLINYGIGGYVQ